jgi:hypothetical protein
MDEPNRSTDGVLDVCEACGGSGIEEGREWDGHPCSECKGAKFILVQDDSEPDGECFRGGEAAAYNAEEQARFQRELK